MLPALLLGAGLFRAAAAREAPGGEGRRPLVVGEIQIIRRDIFSPNEVTRAPALLALVRRAMNGLHSDTREHILRRELLFAPGDPFDPAVLAETERNLRNLGILNQVSVTAADTSGDGRVRILVKVQEAWTLVFDRIAGNV